MAVNDNAGINYWANDVLSPGSEMVDVDFLGPGTGTITSPIIDDGSVNPGTFIASFGAPGTYIIKMKFRWPDGFTIIYPYSIVVTP